MAKFSATQLDIFLAVILFLAGLGYSVSGLPSSIIVACVVWAIAWCFFVHLFLIWDGTDSCPIDIKLVLIGSVTLFLIVALSKPVRFQYLKEHTMISVPQQVHIDTKPPLPFNAPVVRTYVVFDGTMRFGVKRDDKGQPLADQNFQIGDQLFFNYYYKSTGPNPVEMIETARWLYIEPDYEEQTQKMVIADFRRRLKEERNRATGKPTQTLMPGESLWSSAYAEAETKEKRIITLDDLTALHAGTEVAFIVVQITYSDNYRLHHLRTCQWLQPPAMAPGIWHFCTDFTKSD